MSDGDLAENRGIGADGNRRFAGDLALNIEEQRKEKEIDRYLRLQEEV